MDGGGDVDTQIVGRRRARRLTVTPQTTLSGPTETKQQARSDVDLVLGRLRATLCQGRARPTSRAGVRRAQGGAAFQREVHGIAGLARHFRRFAGALGARRRARGEPDLSPVAGP